MCGCVFALISVVSPRLAFLFLWIFTDLVNRAFDGFIFPFLGFLFLPFTTLIYVLVYNPLYGISAWGWAFLVLALFVDVSAYVGSAVSNKDRIPGSAKV